MNRFFLFLFLISLFFHSLTAHAAGDVENTEVLLESEERILSQANLLKALQEKLTQINEELAFQDNSSHQEPIFNFEKRAFKPGMKHPDVLKLREKLIGIETVIVQSGTDAQTVPISENLYLYDDELVKAVKTYQADHGLESDGIIGETTLKMLNRTLEDKKQQILVNIARLESSEWYDRPDLRIEVDIARYWLKAFEDNKVIFEMPVVVGTKARQTNRFTTTMTGVRLNPGWTIPKTIKIEDYIPRLRSNPDWFNRQGVFIYASYDRDATPIDPTTLDWNYLSDTEIQAMRFYKYASDTNPLGRYRFLMHNEFDIYLHDTNLKHLFDRSDRAFSSGCVRVQNPQKITEFLLENDKKWTEKTINDVLAQEDTKNVLASRRIPVYFDYKTAWLGPDNQLILGNDVYDLDKDIKYDNILLSEPYE